MAIYVYRRISVTDNNGFLTIYGHRASLLNNNMLYEVDLTFNPVYETLCFHVMMFVVQYYDIVFRLEVYLPLTLGVIWLELVLLV